MSKKDLLFITEGEADEPDFIKKFLKICTPNVEYNINHQKVFLNKVNCKNNKNVYKNKKILYYIYR